jgi:UDP-N-acetylglucosamine 2-epimerase (non-hydrolysing)
VMTRIAERIPVVFPVHPRTRARLDEMAFASNGARLLLTDPLGYIDFLSLTSHARLVLTDSGGLQEESTALGIPCLTLRDNTERPSTVTQGTNRIVGTDPSTILGAFEECMTNPPAARCPELWDGRAAERIARVIDAFLSGR